MKTEQAASLPWTATTVEEEEEEEERGGGRRRRRLQSSHIRYFWKLANVLGACNEKGFGCDASKGSCNVYLTVVNGCNCDFVSCLSSTAWPKRSKYLPVTTVCATNFLADSFDVTILI